MRDQVAALLNAPSRDEIVFTRNTTESINLVAHSFGRGILSPGQAVVISEMEHHSNLVPWQMLRDADGIELRMAPITDAGEIDMAAYEALLADGRVGLVAMTHMSNVLGSYTPAARIAALAHAAGARVLFDGSQAVVHRAVDVQAIDADFYVFTGHKLYGPTGVGVLWAKRELLEAMPPFLGGGEMISSVTYERSTWARVPHKFEAGTPAIVEVIGLGAAIAYVESIGFDAIAGHEAALTDHALARLSEIPGLEVIGARAGSWRRDFLHHAGGAPARYCYAAGSQRHCRARRPPLRRTADGSPRPGRHGTREFRHLHDPRGNRLPGAEPGTHQGVFFLMFDDVRDLYQDIILRHSRQPLHMRRLEEFDAKAVGDNPMCGDRCEVQAAP